MSVISWAHRQLDRPISDTERRGALTAIAVALIAATLIATTSTGIPASRPVSDRHGEVSPARADREETSPESRAVLHTARRFLDGYLAFVYGRGAAREVKDATPSLTTALERSASPVPPALRTLRPRVLALRAARASGGTVAVSALVKDGEVLEYPIRLLLAVRGGRLLVIGLGRA